MHSKAVASFPFVAIVATSRTIFLRFTGDVFHLMPLSVKKADGKGDWSVGFPSLKWLEQSDTVVDSREVGIVKGLSNHALTFMSCF